MPKDDMIMVNLGDLYRMTRITPWKQITTKGQMMGDPARQWKETG